MSQGKGFASLTAAQKASIYDTDTKPVAFVSAKQGERAVKKRENEVMPRIAPVVEPSKEPAKSVVGPTKEPAKEPAGLTAADISATGENISDYERQADGSYVLKTPKTELDIELEKARTEAEQAKTEVDTAVNQLKSFDISKDPELQGIISSITGQWDTRIRQMEQINKSREASLRQRGLRTGAARYTAGFGGIMSATEQEGLARISELESKKQSAITQARSAFRARKWDEYAKFVDIAEGNYNQEIKELNELGKRAVEENKKRAEKERVSRNEDAVASLMEDGFTDPLDIFITAKEAGLDISPDDIADIIKDLTGEEVEKEEKWQDKLLTPSQWTTYQVPPGTSWGKLADMLEKGEIKMPSRYRPRKPEAAETLETASNTEVQSMVNDTFNSEFRNELFNTLSDDQLRWFMVDFRDTINDAQGKMSIDPVIFPSQFWKAWKKQAGIGEEEVKKQNIGDIKKDILIQVQEDKEFYSKKESKNLMVSDLEETFGSPLPQIIEDAVNEALDEVYK